MLTNKILNIILNITSIFVIPVQIFTTLILGIITSITFGVLSIILSFIWAILFVYPLIGLSYLYEKNLFLRIFTSIIGLPIAILGNTYAVLIPSMGNVEGRITKILLTEVFPYSWQFYKLNLNDAYIKQSKGFPYLVKILNKVKPYDNLRWSFISNLKCLNNIY